MSILDKKLIVTMPDGSKWAVPVRVIAFNRARYYSFEFNCDTERSLDENTIPLFDRSSLAIQDWASNMMNWKDVERHAIMVSSPDSCDYQDGWVNGHKDIE